VWPFISSSGHLYPLVAICILQWPFISSSNHSYPPVAIRIL
jgi:hypothetical protein